VDECSFIDFLIYLQGIDHRREMRVQAQEAGIWIP